MHYRTIFPINALVAVGVGAALIAAPVAQADNGLDATTYVYWRGANCIQVESAQVYNPTNSTVDMLCGGSQRFSEGNIWPGDLFGANPVMGDASYIECAVYRGGMQVWSDYAFAGDGTDVTCLRRAVA